MDVIAAAIVILAIYPPPALLVDPVKPLKTQEAEIAAPALALKKGSLQEVLQHCCIMEIPVQVRL